MRMKRQQIVWAAAVLLGCAALSACAPQTPAAAADSAVMQESASAQRTVTVQAAETVKTVPDMAQLVYTVSTEEADAAACQEENARLVNQVTEYLKGQGIAETSVSTSDFSLNPMYDWSGDARKLTGYEMSTQVTVSGVAVDQVGTLISQGVNAGANGIQSVSYFSSRYDEAYDEALAKAVVQAKGKAEAMAHAENCQVLGVVSMAEASDSQQGRYVDSGTMNGLATAEAASSASDMAVMPGELSVTARVQVVYELAEQ